VLGSVGVMLAGGGALGQLMLAWPNWCGTLAMALGIFAVCATSPQMLFTLNTWIVAGLLVAALVTVVSLWSDPPAGVTTANAPLAVPSLVPASWHGAAVVYATGNLVLTIPLLASMGRRLRQRRHTAVVAAVTGGCLLLLALVIAATLARNAPFTSHLPMLELAARSSTGLGGLYAAGLWLAILSTGVSSAYALIERLREAVHVSRTALSALVVAAALPVGAFGFAQLIGIVYPLIGYLGCALLVVFAVRLPPPG
ncbi:MAG TPA: hypothetical protein VFK80_07435, partial [Limnochordia bacterium]|nr:hypothetical protein [Limnochordia bacterium]